MFVAVVEAINHNLGISQNTLVGLVAAATAVALLLIYTNNPVAKSHYPLVGDDLKHRFFKRIRQRLYWFKHGPEVIHNSFKKIPNTIFTLPGLDRTSIVLPPRFLQEIRDLPHTIASNSHATADFFVGTWTSLDYDIFGHATIEAIKTQYIAKIGQQIEPAANDAAYAFHKHFGSYEDYTPVVAQPKILQLVSQMVARTIVGPDICRDPDWVPAVIGYAQNIFSCTVYLKLVPDFARPLVTTNASLSRMWLLDSFLKESQRFHPPSKLSVNRKMMKDHTLSSGDVLPKDAHVCFAGVPMSMSEEYFEGAEEFDGFRFERLRRKSEKEQNGLQFTSSYGGSLHFGHGRYMCPGRFMGSLISKLLMIEILQRYDLKLGPGGRPENIMFFDVDIPNPEYEILFKDRVVETK